MKSERSWSGWSAWARPRRGRCCTPGLSPVTFSPAAEQTIATHKTKVQSWYLDMNMVRQYWGTERLYHHTAPINMIYALHEALRLVLEEGLAARWQRHLRCHQMLKVELEAMGIRFLADPAHQLPMLNAVAVPEGVDEADARKRLLEEFAIEIGGGLGAFKGKAWRIGLMGESATEQKVRGLVSALRQLIASGRPSPRSAPIGQCWRAWLTSATWSFMT